MHYEKKHYLADKTATAFFGELSKCSLHIINNSTERNVIDVWAIKQQLFFFVCGGGGRRNAANTLLTMVYGSRVYTERNRILYLKLDRIIANYSMRKTSICWDLFLDCEDILPKLQIHYKNFMW